MKDANKAQRIHDHDGIFFRVWQKQFGPDPFEELEVEEKVESDPEEEVQNWFGPKEADLLALGSGGKLICLHPKCNNKSVPWDQIHQHFIRFHNHGVTQEMWAGWAANRDYKRVRNGCPILIYATVSSSCC